MNTKLIAIYIVWNIVVYAVYGYDKLQAKRDGWRVPEKTLMGMALVFGALGAWIGMQSFRHKTKHNLFKIGVPICMLINFVGLYYLANFNVIEWWLER